jgi:hypothetical protein
MNAHVGNYHLHKTSPSSRFILIAVLGVPILIAAIVFGPAALDLTIHRRPPERFLIPAGYTGWVRIDFRQPGAPPLPVENGHRVLKLNHDGTLKTSSEVRPGRGDDDFFYYSGDQRSHLSNAGVCKGGMIWGLETLVDERGSIPFIRFFVGTEDQYRNEVDPAGKSSVCE